MGKKKKEQMIQSPEPPKKRKRGRPEKNYKIDDTPLNVARALWGETFNKVPQERQNRLLMESQCGSTLCPNKTSSRAPLVYFSSARPIP